MFEEVIFESVSGTVMHANGSVKFSQSFYEETQWIEMNCGVNMDDWQHCVGIILVNTSSVIRAMSN